MIICKMVFLVNINFTDNNIPYFKFDRDMTYISSLFVSCFWLVKSTYYTVASYRNTVVTQLKNKDLTRPTPNFTLTYAYNVKIIRY